jgi:hypothetical protein
MKKTRYSVGMSLVIVATLFGMLVSVQAAGLVTVQGTVYDTDGTTYAPNGVTVTVTDLNTSAVLSTATQYDVGFYQVVFGWPVTAEVTAGHLLRVVADDGAGKQNTTEVPATGSSPQVVNLVLAQQPCIPGFEAVFAFSWVLALVYVLRRTSRQ